MGSADGIKGGSSWKGGRGGGLLLNRPNLSLSKEFNSYLTGQRKNTVYCYISKQKVGFANFLVQITEIYVT